MLEKMLTYENIEMGGPSYLFKMIKVFTLTTEDAMRAMTARMD